MKLPLHRDVPPRAAVVVVALALVAGVVTGAPWTSAPPVAEPGARTAAPVSQEVPAEPLDLDSLQRRKKTGTVPDLFASQAPPPRAAAAPALQASPPPPAPAPAPLTLPYRYLGRMVSAEHSVVFLVSDKGLYSAAAGDVLDNAFRVESISDSSVTFRHPSHDSALTLPIPPAP